MRTAILFILAALTLSIAQGDTGTAKPARESPGKPGARPVSSASPVPFEFRLGTTTLSDAEVRWQQAGVRQAGRGHLALGTGSGRDGGGSVAAENILLVDIEGVDFEGARTTRFGFYDGVLYLVQARLRSMLRDDASNPTQLDETGMKKLEQSLRAKYGPPTSILKDMYAGKTPNVYLWKFASDELVLTTNPMSSTLVLVHRPSKKKADLYTKELCARERAKGVSCW